MSFFGELRRRNVVKVAVAYAIVGWLLVQIADTFFPALQLPEWTVTFVAGLVILGFPLALILSWAYELTPAGMERTKSVPLSESITHVTGRKIDFAIIGALVLALGFVVYNYVLDTAGPFAGAEIDPASLDPALVEVPPTVAEEAGPAAPAVEEEQREILPNSVAVLPFENLSPDPDNDYYAAGIHEEILNHLVKLSALNVIARTSMRQYANTEKSIPEIARELNVETVMEGSVRYAGGQIRVTAQLNDGVTGAHLWSETYTRDFEDIFAIESDVAMNVANAVGAEFSLEEQASIEKVPTKSPAAYALYLRALTTAGTVAMQGSDVLQVADAYLDQAIEFDPQFALAYVRKALLVATVGRQSTRSYVEKALELDPNLGIAHSALATADATLLLEAEAREGYERALELSPNEAEILNDFARFYSFTEQHEDAINLAQRAVSLDPNNSASHFTLGTAYLFAGNVDVTVDAMLRASILNPTDARPYLVLGRIEAGRGNQAEAARYLQTAAELIASDSPTFALVAHGYALAGLHEQAVEFVTRFRALGDNSELFHALTSLALGESDEALEFLTILAEGEGQDSSYGAAPMQVKFNVFSDPALDEPEFVAVRERLGFPDL